MVSMWGSAPWVRAFVGDVVEAVVTTDFARPFVHSLAKVRDLLVAWASLSRMMPFISFLFQPAGWLMVLARTTVQLRGGDLRSRDHDWRSEDAPGCPRHWCLRSPSRSAGPVAPWLASQLRTTLAAGIDSACAYLLSGERAAYTGSTHQCHRMQPGETSASPMSGSDSTCAHCGPPGPARRLAQGAGLRPRVSRHLIHLRRRNGRSGCDARGGSRDHHEGCTSGQHQLRDERLLAPPGA